MGGFSFTGRSLSSAFNCSHRLYQISHFNFHQLFQDFHREGRLTGLTWHHRHIINPNVHLPVSYPMLSKRRNWIKHSRLLCALVSHHYKLFHLPSSCLECKMIKCISFHASKFVGGIAIRKGPQWFWLCTAMTAIMNWRLLAKTHPGSEVVSTVLFLSPIHHCSLNSNSTIVTYHVR